MELFETMSGKGKCYFNYAFKNVAGLLKTIIPVSDKAKVVTENASKSFWKCPWKTSFVEKAN